MAVLEVLTYPDDRLKIKSDPVESVDESIRKLAGDLIETMYENNGAGLAAPQVGIHKQIIIITPMDDDTGNEPIAMINPQIVQAEGKILLEEGCVSIPDIFSDVERPEKVRVVYTDLNGVKREMDATGWTARVIQHELDHLTGKLFWEHLPQTKKQRLASEYKSRNTHERPPESHPAKL